MSFRAGDSDRERVAEVLRQAAGEGRITLDELEDRLTATFQARTYAELAAVTTDLGTVDAALVRRDEEPLRLAGSGGAVQRNGRWRVPARIVVDRNHGSVVLDFTDAVFEHPVTSVEVRMKYGSMTLILPDSATAELACDTKYGRVRSSVAGIPNPGHPHLKVTGEKAYGSLRVRYGRRNPLRRRTADR